MKFVPISAAHSRLGATSWTLAPRRRNTIDSSDTAVRATVRITLSRPSVAGMLAVGFRHNTCVSRPAGAGIAHSFRAGGQGCTFLAYGGRSTNDVIYYPDSNKIFFKGVGLIARTACLAFATENTHGFEIAHLGGIVGCVDVLERWLAG